MLIAYFLSVFSDIKLSYHRTSSKVIFCERTERQIVNFINVCKTWTNLIFYSLFYICILMQRVYNCTRLSQIWRRALFCRYICIARYSTMLRAHYENICIEHKRVWVSCGSLILIHIWQRNRLQNMFLTSAAL